MFSEHVLQHRGSRLSAGKLRHRPAILLRLRAHDDGAMFRNRFATTH